MKGHPDIILFGDKLFDLLNSIDKDQAENSDYDGNRNAEDAVESYSTASTRKTSNTATHSTPLMSRDTSPAPSGIQTRRRIKPDDGFWHTYTCKYRFSTRNIQKLHYRRYTMQLILDETCMYASHNGKQMEFDVKELEAFLGTLIIMGFRTLSSIQLY
ncbi:hypothetical protein ILUMI_27166 [Ignelater luminosus]|uniref:PiggyBac transposable element-derived protein domain-containing protein n=1 Tax=Ignelater luminosus TaxID=2038154 RepID=A0A8K0C6P4_IGNLU|nr:hypothetical protein ILUMI_27166 [Ignelater luminosus]